MALHDPAAILVFWLACMAVAGTVQAVCGWLALRRFLARRRSAPARATVSEPITVLKPLHGDEPLLERALSTFFEQDYPCFQLVFSVQSASDPAIGTVRELQRVYPHVDSALIIDPTCHGANKKVGNLLNALAAAKHDLLVISDSDMHVAPDYLTAIAATLVAPGVGLVTSLYAGLPASGTIAGKLGAAYINQVFVAGAALSRHLGRRDCMGATMALHRRTLAAVGGFETLLPFVADDAVLGERVRGLGLNVALAPVIPATTVPESRVIPLLRHELRWSRTIRAVAPIGFVLSSLQFPTVWGALAATMSGFAPIPLAVALGATVTRAAVGRALERALGAAPSPLWLAPVRDFLSVGVMAASYAGREVAWRGQIHVANGRGTSAAPATTLLVPEQAVS